MPTLPTHSENSQGCGHCPPATSTLSCSTFRDTACSAGHRKQEHFQALLPSTTPSSGLILRMASYRGKRSTQEMRSTGAAEVSHITLYMVEKHRLLEEDKQLHHSPSLLASPGRGKLLVEVPSPCYQVSDQVSLT